ncbi:hypothetical protein HWV62_26700 [Athelia sp. TMB]|nr:hypothetical protein HWV62_26700 [Athelia sp. TMB]
MASVSDNEDDRTVARFNTHGSGTVTNVNGNYIRSRHIAQQTNIYFILKIPSWPRGFLERLRKAYMEKSSIHGPSRSNTSRSGTTRLLNTPSYSSAKCLINQVLPMIDLVRMMMDNPILCSSANLSEVLTGLQEILCWTKLVLKAYRRTPLEKSLNIAIAIGVDRCVQLVQELLRNLSNYRYTLSEAVLYFIRRYVCRRIGETGVAEAFNSELRDCHKTFAAYLLALGRAAWPGLEQGSSQETIGRLTEFYSLLEQESKSLGHIIIDTDFHTVISGFCRDSAGYSLVQRGDYRIWNSENDNVISPEDIATSLGPGMRVEMSIVLHAQAEERRSSQAQRCPRCRHLNREVVTESGWLDWISVLRKCAYDEDSGAVQRATTSAESLRIAETTDILENPQEDAICPENIIEEARDVKHSEGFQIIGDDQGKYSPETSEQTANNHPSLNAAGASSTEDVILAAMLRKETLPQWRKPADSGSTFRHTRMSQTDVSAYIPTAPDPEIADLEVPTEIKFKSLSQRRANIIIFGHTGTGKSSLVNLIAGKEVAEITDSGAVTTFASHPYDIDLPSGHAITLWDTAGLDEMQTGKVDANKAISDIYALTRTLHGVHLLICCLRGRIGDATVRNYNLLNSFCDGQVPIVLVINGSEHRSASWWDENSASFAEVGINAVDHACVDTRRLPGRERDYAMWTTMVRDMIVKRYLRLPWVMEGNSWSSLVVMKLVEVLFDGYSERSKGLYEGLLNNGYSKEDARKAAKQYEATLKKQKPNHHQPTISADPSKSQVDRSDSTGSSGNSSQRANVIVFGQSGAGKSSLINMIAQKDIAKTSADITGCTPNTRGYVVPLSNGILATICDTAGLNENSEGSVPAVIAIANIFQLIRSFASDGLSLLIFCMRGQINASTARNYNIIKSLCKGKAPVALVVTGLENELDRGKWWEANQANFTEKGMTFDYHACVVTVRGPGNEKQGFLYGQQYKESGVAVRSIIEAACMRQPWKPEPHHGLKVQMKRLLRPVAARPSMDSLELFYALKSHGFTQDEALRATNKGACFQDFNTDS